VTRSCVLSLFLHGVVSSRISDFLCVLDLGFDTESCPFAELETFARSCVLDLVLTRNRVLAELETFARSCVLDLVLTWNRVLAELETFARSCVLDLVLTRSCVFLIQSRCRGGTQPHTDLMHFVAATIFTFTIHSQRVVRLGHCVSEPSVGSASVVLGSKELESEDEARHCSNARRTASGEVRRCLPRLTRA